MMIEQYDIILLKDGREGCAVEILGNQEMFIVDVGMDADTWDTLWNIKKSDIRAVKRGGNWIELEKST